ncbi:chorismate synthase [Porphyromonas sp.]|uniref:chorismate synthase n=1 Tax=Porphyromonas sp. TaxID=1924944 RepID=UPI0026DB19DD|nr:chorismate synthase [Porphyromonas sp.]MDO4695893.1 chorismate synthase [Porphyromonas sp.]MDO4771800.1 chorismate synthase [Porphyromonas sp.]
MNTFGRIFRLTTFGESHGAAIGGVIDGCPPGMEIDMDAIAQSIERRKGKGGITTARSESDIPHFLSGIFEGKTTGTPIAFVIQNKTQESKDYDHLKDVFRPSHADYTYAMKYGVRDHRGGGRASARETVVRVVAGEIAAQILRKEGINIVAYTARVGEKALPNMYYDGVSRDHLSGSMVGCPDAESDKEMFAYLSDIRAGGNTVGGIVAVCITGVPAGVGSPLYEKLEARLASAMLSIGASKGVEIGDGFAMAEMRGSDANDQMRSESGAVRAATNHSGGIQGGISNGEEIRLRVAFKPIASISLAQKTVNTEGKDVDLSITGRHDASVFPRVLPVVEAMASLVIIDELLCQRLYARID